MIDNKFAKDFSFDIFPERERERKKEGGRLHEILSRERYSGVQLNTIITSAWMANEGWILM